MIVGTMKAVLRGTMVYCLEVLYFEQTPKQIIVLCTMQTLFLVAVLEFVATSKRYKYGAVLPS